MCTGALLVCGHIAPAVVVTARLARQRAHGTAAALALEQARENVRVRFAAARSTAPADPVLREHGLDALEQIALDDGSPLGIDQLPFLPRSAHAVRLGDVGL